MSKLSYFISLKCVYSFQVLVLIYLFAYLCTYAVIKYLEVLSLISMQLCIITCLYFHVFDDVTDILSTIKVAHWKLVILIGFHGLFQSIRKNIHCIRFFFNIHVYFH
jgi:hypothetical protein